MKNAYPELFSQIPFGEHGLVPVIVQQHDTREVLMLAWMSPEALLETLDTGRMCYWSRSRHCLWRKGETSGQVQMLKELILDCDGDALLALINQTGVACHTGRRSCFYYSIRNGKLVVNQEPEIDPRELYKKD